MTQQDDITQRALTDDEIMRSAISACDSLNITRFHEIGAPSKTIMDDAGLLELGRALEGAVLSKLRAPMADERALQAWADRFPEISDMGRLRDAWNDARACTPAPGWGCAHKNKVANVAAYVWFCRDCNKFIPREPGDSALASAPIAGEAQPVAVTDHQGDVHWRHGRKAGIALYAAPQASECECSRKSKAVSDSEAQL
ncbi:hypothetical protein ACOTJC_29065 [Achromobacter xylosoxidans]|uniref:hypothetical protein n=1 Tax=Alcaligenes xylosoxydans xylosoxydans TaxID=85698 RepID=UPI002E1768D4|nr:hypothetical protein [Achromobacter xylosoxidans]